MTKKPQRQVWTWLPSVMLLVSFAAYGGVEGSERAGPTAPSQGDDFAELLGDGIQDGGFEAGTPNPFWNEFSQNFGTPICDVNSCGLGGGSGPFMGSYWSWFGGISGVSESGSVDQDVTISPGNQALSFWLEIPVADTTGFMAVKVDGNELFRVTEADAVNYPVYTEVLVDITAFADGGVHNVSFESTTDAGLGPANFFIDDVALEGDLCRIALTADRKEARAGEAVNLDIRLKHNRIQSVHVPLSVWIEDRSGNRLMGRKTETRALHYGDSLRETLTIRVPEGLDPDLYFFVVGVEQMQQGQAFARRPIRVVD